MRSPEQIAIDISNGDKKAKKELEKMWGVRFEDMTIEERRLGAAKRFAYNGIANTDRTVHGRYLSVVPKNTIE